MVNEERKISIDEMQKAREKWLMKGRRGMKRSITTKKSTQNS
jgi:hypothetical protein